MRADFQDFENRTGLPSRGTREDLESLKARYFTTEPFNYGGQQRRIEQMQKEVDGRGYIWKRQIPAGDVSDTVLFEIHLEATSTGIKHYETTSNLESAAA